MTAEIAIRDNELLPGATETALLLPDNLNVEEWIAIGEKLGRANRAWQWWVGDWINYAEARWGQKFTEAERITGLTYGYLNQCAVVARRFNFVDRSTKLTWTHHYKAKALTDAEEWLARAEAESWSTRELVEKSSAAPVRTQVMPTRRHVAFVAAADNLVRVGERWERSMTDAITPPQARKQLTVLRKAAALLDEAIQAVEYRADTLATFRR